MCYSVQPDYYGATGANLRYFRPQEIKDKKNKIVGYSPHTYMVKMCITDSTHRKIEEVYDLIKREILDKFPKGQKVYTHIYKLHQKTVQDLKDDPENDWCQVGESDFQRLERDENGTIRRVLLTKKEYHNHAGEENLNAQGYAKIVINNYSGFRDHVLVKKKNFKSQLNTEEF